MNEILTAIAGIIVGGGTFWGLVKGGFIKIQIGKNGNGKSSEIEELKTQLNNLQDNHLHELGEKIDRLTEKMVEHNAKEIVLLEDIKDKLK